MASINKSTDSKGKTRYRVRVRLKGCPIQTATFERLTDAKKWVQDTESAIREGRHFKTAEAKRHTLGELVDRYIENVLAERSDAQRVTTQMLWWKKALGDYLLSDVTPALIAEQRDVLLKGITVRGRQRSPSTVVRYMAALSHAYSIAVNEWGWVDDTPMRKVKKPKEPTGRVRFLSDDERSRLLKACHGSEYRDLYLIVVLALSTGMRKGEIMWLKWADVFLSDGFLVLHKTKNKERRRIPLAGHVFDELKKHAKVRRIDTELLFAGKNADKPMWFRKRWVTALKEAKITDFRFHDLRHSAASYLAMNGASLAEISEVLGHKTLQMVKRYAHLSDAHTSKVVASMNEKIFKEQV